MDLSTGWTSVGNGSFTSASGYIPTFTVPSLLNAQIVAIKISTDNAKPTWYTGAWVDQKVLTGLDGSMPWITFSKKIGLGGNIIFFPQVISDYSIDISFPNYFKTVSVGVWDTRMNTQKGTIAVATSPQQGIVITLETTEIFLATLVSVSILSGVAIRVISKMNTISSSITQIEKALKEQASNTEKIARLDRTLDLHIQEYVNRKDVVQMVLGQLDQKINHKFKRLLFYTRDIQRFLQKGGNFTIREYEENTEEE